MLREEEVQQNPETEAEEECEEVEKEKEKRETEIWKPDVLVLGPGGIKGFFELGALCYLEERGYLSDVNIFMGVSVGAIISLMMVCGYKIIEIIAESADANIFDDLSSVSLKDTQRKLGLISNAPIKRKLVNMVSKKFGYIPTLKQLYDTTGLELYCVTGNLDKETAEYMSYRTEPHLPVIDAVMYSMNIPIVFYKLKYKGCVYVDGALANPYPVDILDDGSKRILGLYIESTSKTDSEPQDSTTTMYIHKLIHFTMNQLRNRIIDSCSENCKHIRLPTDIIDTTGLTVDADVKADMIIKGYKIAQEFLKNLEVECNLEHI